MECKECLASAINRWHGVYDMGCLRCCARQVLALRPSRAMQDAAIAAAVSRGHAREDVIAAVKEVAGNG